tara:strand:- start:2161 stop:2460 length:300 start_codon:yes stop_codon:yes gene_type:complete
MCKALPYGKDAFAITNPKGYCPVDTMNNKFQRRHYEEIANQLGWYQNRIVLSPFNRYRKRDNEQFQFLLNEMLKMFKRDNPNFNEERFLKAMKTYEEVI